jgi:glycyl-tRNA synthetase beta chain
MPDLLYEIGTEEIPAGYLEPALAQLAEEVGRRLAESRLPADDVRTAGTPRRMTIFASGIPDRQPAVEVKSVGPPARVAFDADGNPSPAALGFARKQNVDVQDLTLEESGKGSYVVAVVKEPGLPAADVLPRILAEATAAISFPKSMHWETDGFLFARPVRWLVALLGKDVVPVRVADVSAGRCTQGHPFLANGSIELKNASRDAYCDVLREHRVLVDIAERREAIRAQISSILQAHGSELADNELLEEVTNLVEWPCAIEGSFDEHFLEVPAPVVVASMKGHQRYFPVRNAKGELLARFVTVANRTQEQTDLVREGNERVLLARLEDARFFWEEDRQKGQDALVPKLKDVVFLAGLGSNLQRTERLEELAGLIAQRLGGGAVVEEVRRAARLCKADLLTGLVGEFPSLQGVVGCELARAQGEPEAVSRAIADHYLPVGADDNVPATPAGCCLALADKLDVIVGCFSLCLLPSGSQDPYALRRNALGILLTIEKKGLDLHLGELLQMARRTAADHDITCADEAAAKIEDFLRDRLYNAALDRGHRHDFVRAVLSADIDDVRAFWQRLAALEQCADTEWWPRLVELVDRTFRIQRDADRIVPVSEELLQEDQEKALAAALAEHAEEVTALLDAGEYVQGADRYCSAFAQLVHDFFEEVFVNVEDEELRLHRKSLCGHVYHLFAERFADLYLIETAENGN